MLYRQFRDLKIETDHKVACQVDGDLGPSTPLTVSVSDKRIKLLVPPEDMAPNFWTMRGGDIL